MRWLRFRPARPAGDSGAPASGTSGPNGERWLRRLAGYCWRHRRLTIVAVGASLLATVVTIIIPLIQRDIIDNAIVTHHQPIWPGATLLLVAAVISFFAVYLRRYRGGQLSLDVQHDLRTDLFGSLTRLYELAGDRDRIHADLGLINGALDELCRARRPASASPAPATAAATSQPATAGRP